MLRRTLTLLALIAITNSTYAHFCCYSDTRTYYTEPAGFCLLYIVERVDWKEYWPASSDPQHGHYWATGAYEQLYGPIPDPNCEIGLKERGPS